MKANRLLFTFGGDIICFYDAFFHDESVRRLDVLVQYDVSTLERLDWILV